MCNCGSPETNHGARRRERRHITPIRTSGRLEKNLFCSQSALYVFDLTRADFREVMFFEETITSSSGGIVGWKL